MSSPSLTVNSSEMADKLIISYSKLCLSKAIENSESNRQERYSKLDSKDKGFILKLSDVAKSNEKHRTPSELDKALDSIDLAKIYEGVDKREREPSQREKELGLKYEDLIVLELLHYFKHDFFKWVNRPSCPRCGEESDNIVPTGNSGSPRINPDEISIVENYKCTKCNIAVSFPRYNNPVKLLETRSGRCGEWVNCFMLILRALLGSECQVRYVWNNEDHVWSEYYSSTLERWIHLDPCEAAFDEPNLYCENWGKKMSWCFAFGDGYVMDVSDKYITKSDKQLNKLDSVSSLDNIKGFIDVWNDLKLVKYYKGLEMTNRNESENLMKLYKEVLLIRNREKRKEEHTSKATNTELPKGRQTGDASWTKSRGEDGN